MFSARYAALALALFGCGREAAPGPAPRELSQAPITPPREPAPAAPPLPVTSASAAASAPAVPVPPPAPRFVHVELAPTQGDLAPLLRDVAARAKEKALRPVVEFYADWCAPCRIFQQSLGEPQIAEALEGTYLVRLNLDDWHDKLKGTGIDKVRTIPSFYLLDAAGRANGKMLDGDKWGKTTPALMGAALKVFLGGGA